MEIHSFFSGGKISRQEVIRACVDVCVWWVTDTDVLIWSADFLNERIFCLLATTPPPPLIFPCSLPSVDFPCVWETCWHNISFITLYQASYGFVITSLPSFDWHGLQKLSQFLPNDARLSEDNIVTHTVFTWKRCQVSQVFEEDGPLCHSAAAPTRHNKLKFKNCYFLIWLPKATIFSFKVFILRMYK